MTAPDSPSLAWLRTATEDERKQYVRSCGIPHRLLLPKGKTAGMDFTLLVAVTDGNKDKAVEHPEQSDRSHSQCGVHGGRYPDKRPMGYPVDRRIPDERVFLGTPNIKRVPVQVFHDEAH